MAFIQDGRADLSGLNVLLGERTQVGGARSAPGKGSPNHLPPRRSRHAQTLEGPDPLPRKLPSQPRPALLTQPCVQGAELGGRIDVSPNLFVGLEDSQAVVPSPGLELCGQTYRPKALSLRR